MLAGSINPGPWRFAVVVARGLRQEGFPRMQPGEALFVHPGLKIRPCEWGYGVFTDVAIPEGTILEEAHYLKVPFRTVRSSALSDYVFNIEWGPHEEDRGGEWVAIVMGSGM